MYGGRLESVICHVKIIVVKFYIFITTRAEVFTAASSPKAMLKVHPEIKCFVVDSPFPTAFNAG
ncbi:hypothetical protein DZF84_13950 [Vibrio parahaemolyticus]|nr:hypothetical protein [Vibrio parahaemolyticus]